MTNERLREWLSDYASMLRAVISMPSPSPAMLEAANKRLTEVTLYLRSSAEPGGNAHDNRIRTEALTRNASIPRHPGALLPGLRSHGNDRCNGTNCKGHPTNCYGHPIDCGCSENR